MPVSARGGGEHVGEDLVAGDLADGEFSPVKPLPLHRLTDAWDRVDSGPRCQPLGALGRVYLAFRVLFVFLYSF